jgi:hypothetical protein
MREEIVDQIVELERKIAVLPEGSVSKITNKKTIRRQDNHPSADGLFLSFLFDQHPGQHRQNTKCHDESDAPSPGFRQEECRLVRMCR